MARPLSVSRAIWKEKCPRCRQGDLFASSAYTLNEFYRMYKHCHLCKQTFEPEPGFYFGAMFVAYGMLVIMSLLTWITLFFIFRPLFEVYVVVILILNVLLLPFIFRYSRTLYLFGFGGIEFNDGILNE
jgi:uncharacterized protein (DUF983 family)